MITIKGKTACGGVAFGPVFVFSREESTVKRMHVESSEAEIERFEDARVKAIDELEQLYKKAVSEVGENNAMIFHIHQMMLDDMDYIESIKNIIADQLINAETAVAQTCDNFVAMFEAMEDTYIRERSADVKDVSERIIKILSGVSGSGIITEEPSVIIADNLAPSETVQFDKSRILAFVTERGASNSHTSILARMMNIPAVIGAKDILDKSYNGRMAIVDGYEGTIYIDPDEETTQKMTEKLKATQHQKELLDRLKGMPSVTKDGRTVRIYANADNILDVAPVLQNDAEGIGLFRSEFIYMESRECPTEEMQFNIYKELLSKMNGKRVVVRTLDIGADKRAEYLNLPDETNPAMGTRGIRFSLKRPDIFKTQLRALLRASVSGNLAVMFPMIASEWELLKALEIMEEAKKELTDEGIAFASGIEVGCMIETPSAVLISDILAKHLDFVSIGTNDLTQYTLAADRQNPDISQFYDERHLAVIRSIEIVTKNAHENGAWVGVCGELAGDTDFTETLLAIGVDEISVTPAAVLPIRGKVRETDAATIKDRA